MFCKLLCISLMVGLGRSIPVDNGVEGEPEIECGPTSISISFNTRNPFEGHVYVKGLFAEGGCRSDGNGQQRTGSITLGFDQCNTQRSRSLNPRGVFVGNTVIISFHPKFETKVDKAYKVQCFYMESDKTVSTGFEVSMLTTLFQTQTVPMPVCRYQILNGGPNGQPVKYAIVGQSVYHKWTCDTETVNTFCMRIYNCFVDDGHGDKVDLLDEKGCAQDRFLLNNLEYPTDLMAGKEANVFKYADRIALSFQCQIEITIKEPGGQCPHPQCSEPTKGKRSAELQQQGQVEETEQEELRQVDPNSVVDVSTELTALDADEKLHSTSHQPIDFSGNLSLNRLLTSSTTSTTASTSNEICLSTMGFGLFLAFLAVVLLSTVLTVALLCTRSSRQEK